MSVIYYGTQKAGKITMGRTQHQNSIIKVGYIFNKNYRKQFQLNTKIGMEERQSLLKLIEDILQNSLNRDIGSIGYNIFRRGNNITLEIELYDQVISINFDTINSIVTQNQDRKINKKIYYPYDKTMDKYNSVYVSVVSNNPTEESYKISESVLMCVMDHLNIFHDIYLYQSMVIHSPISV